MRIYLYRELHKPINNHFCSILDKELVTEEKPWDIINANLDRYN